MLVAVRRASGPTTHLSRHLPAGSGFDARRAFVGVENVATWRCDHARAPLDRPNASILAMPRREHAADALRLIPNAGRRCGLKLKGTAAATARRLVDLAACTLAQRQRRDRLLIDRRARVASTIEKFAGRRSTAPSPSTASSCRLARSPWRRPQARNRWSSESTGIHQLYAAVLQRNKTPSPRWRSISPLCTTHRCWRPAASGSRTLRFAVNHRCTGG